MTDCSEDSHTHTHTNTTITFPMLKAISAWLAALSTSLWNTWVSVSWDKAAQFAAFIYTLCLISDWIRKKLTKKGKESGSNKDIS